MARIGVNLSALGMEYVGALVIPCYQDFESVESLIGKIVGLQRWNQCCDIWIVNDCPLVGTPSFTKRFKEQVESCSWIGSLSVIELTRNLGQQAAIAVGVSHCLCDRSRQYSWFAVMDADGEDDPDALPTLLDSLEESGVVLARRGKRTESKRFVLGYRTYQILFWLGVGSWPDFGNFMVLTRAAAMEVFSDPDSWTHLASTVLKRIHLFRKITVDRGRRFYGSSRMGWSRLIYLAITAISLHVEKVVARVAVLSAFFWSLTVLAIAYLVVKKLFLGSPLGWATILSIQLLSFSSLMTVSFFIVVFTVSLARSRRGLSPLEVPGKYVMRVLSITS